MCIALLITTLCCSECRDPQHPHKTSHAPPPPGQVRLGRSGIEEYLPLGPVSQVEQRNYDLMMAELASSIKNGLDFVEQRKQ